jgi:hypothetical protein
MGVPHCPYGRRRGGEEKKMATAKRVSIALLAPGFLLALLLPLLGVVAMLIGGVTLAIALENDLVAAEGGPGARLRSSSTRS